MYWDQGPGGSSLIPRIHLRMQLPSVLNSSRTGIDFRQEKENLVRKRGEKNNVFVIHSAFIPTDLFR